MDRDLYIDSLLRILNPLRRDLKPESGARGFGEVEVIENSINADKRTVTAMLSTPNVDRYGELIEPEAFRDSLPMFRRNPVLLAGHASSGHEPTAIGKWIEIDITKKGLVGTCQFMEDDELAEKWWKRYQQGVLRAFSVGFIVQATELRDFKMKDGTTQRLRVHTKSELLEVSCVALPANRESLVVGASAGGRGGAGEQSARQLSNRQLETAARILTPVIRDVLRHELTADEYSHGPLRTLVMEIVEATLESQGMTSRAPGARNASSSGDDLGTEADWENEDNYDETGAYTGAGAMRVNASEPDLCDALSNILAGRKSQR